MNWALDLTSVPIHVLLHQRHLAPPTVWDGKMVCSPITFIHLNCLKKLKHNVRTFIHLHVHLFLFFVDCKKDMNTTLPALSSSVRCNVPSFCTGITCCIEENKVLRRHFTVGVELDDCNHIMTFQVEQLKIQIKLHDYSFGNPLFVSILVLYYSVFRRCQYSLLKTTIQVSNFSVNRSH